VDDTSGGGWDRAEDGRVSLIRGLVIIELGFYSFADGVVACAFEVEADGFALWLDDVGEDAAWEISPAVIHLFLPEK